jgi:hypothetical protein
MLSNSDFALIRGGNARNREKVGDGIVGVSDVPPVLDKGVPVQIISYLISVRV